MLKCDGYKMFKGTATVTPVNGRPPYGITGTWLFRPDTDYWYVEDGKTWWSWNSGAAGASAPSAR